MFSNYLKIAWNLLPKLPVDDLDVLLVDELGKNVSGAGMDPNVIGFWRRASVSVRFCVRRACTGGRWRRFWRTVPRRAIGG